MESIFETVKRRFETKNLRYDQIDEEPVLRTGFGGKNGNFIAYAYVDDSRRLLEVQSMCPVNAPSNKRSAMAELLARINWTLTLGNFELDMNDGEIRFRTSVKLGQDDMDEEIVDHVVFANFITMDRFFPALTSVLYSNVSPEKALKTMASQEESNDADKKAACHDTQPNNTRFGGRLGDLMGPSNN